MKKNTLKPDDRVWKAFNHEEPDRVPLYEGAIEIKELNPGATLGTSSGILFYNLDILRYFGKPWFQQIRKLFFKLTKNPHVLPSLLKPFIKPIYRNLTRIYGKLGIDLVPAAGGLPMVLDPKIFDDITIKERTIYSPAGDIATKESKTQGAIYRNGFLRGPADYNKYISYDPDARANYFLTPQLLKFARGKFSLAFSVFGAAAFENLCEMFGFETLFRLLVKEPAFIKRVVKEMSDYSTAVLEHMATHGERMIFYMTDDLGHKGRPIISPRMYRKYFKEGVTRFCKLAHEYGHKVMMHSDGNVMELIPDFVGAGIDALHPWESDAGMDMVEGKRNWGDKICLVGNVPIELLTRGTINQVDTYVKNLIENVAPGGGFILSSSHSIVSTCKLENYKQMLLSARNYGKYPIR